MHKKFEIKRTKIKDGCQSRRKVVTHDSKSDLSLMNYILLNKMKVFRNSPPSFDISCMFAVTYNKKR